MDQRKKYLLKNTALFALGSFGTKMISFFLVPLYTNVLTTAEYGVVDLITTISTILAPVIILNISESIMRFALDHDANHNKILSTGVAVFGGAIVFGLVLIPLASNISMLKEYAGYLYFYTITLSGSQLFLFNLRGREQLLAFSVGNIIHTLAIAVFNIYFLLVAKQGIEGYFIAYILSNVITALYAFFAGRTWEQLKHFHLDAALSKQMIAYSIVLIPNSFMWWIINSSDRIMVTAMVGVAANGVYAISYKIPSLVQTITNIFNQAWSYSAIRENQSADRDAYCNRVFNGVVAISTISGVGLLAIIKVFLRFYVEENYYSAWKYTPYLMVGYVFLTLATFLSTYYTVNKDSKGFLFSSMCGATVNLILNAVLIPVIGVSGAALATCISYVAVYLFRIIDTKKYITIDFLRPKHIAAYSILLLAGATVFWDTGAGQAALIVELFALIWIFKQEWYSLVSAIGNKFASGKAGDKN